MASFVYAVWSITNVASVHCALRPEISPCTCEPMFSNNYVDLSCEKVDSFHQIVDALSNKFEPNVNISLKISYSQLEDLEMRAFTDMNMNLVKLRMPYNSLKSMPELPFRGLSNLEYLSIGDNELDEIPKHMLNHMPLVKTLEMGRLRIRSVLQDDFKGTQYVTNLFLAKNNIMRLDKGSFPPDLVILHLGRNQIESLNGTLRDLSKLESLFINVNSISTLEDELPESNRLKLIIAHNNRLERLPESMRHMTKLETLHLHYNRLKSLNGTFKNARNLNQFYAYSNEIETLLHDEFASSDYLEELDLALNHIKCMNYSLLPLTRLRSANFSFNEIEEFSMNEIRGLFFLKQLDLSNNHIQKLTGRKDNNIEQDSFLVDFKLNNNRLKTLDGALMNLNSLRILNLASNEIDRILPEDFIGLVKLEILDLSYNKLITLKELATTFLSNLKILKAASNKLTRLENDFHGLPVLCQANLTNNEISSISVELVSQTRCMNHNVPGKLELYLEDNPIMCDEVLNTLCPIMSSQNTRIRGKSQCFDSDQEVCTALPMLFPPIISDSLPIIIKTPLNPQLLPVIIQNPILLSKPPKNGEEILPPLIASLGQPAIEPIIVLQTGLPSIPSPINSIVPSVTHEVEVAPKSIENEQIPDVKAFSNEANHTEPISENNNEEVNTQLHDIEKGNERAEILIPIDIEDMANITTNVTELKPEDIITTTTTTILPTTTIPVEKENDEHSVLNTSLPIFYEENTSTTSTTTTTPTVTTAVPQILNEDKISTTNNTGDMNDSNVNNTTQSSVTFAPVEYIPNFNEFDPVRHPSPDIFDDESNSVHEEFPSVVLKNIENAPEQNQFTPNDPPGDQ